MKLVIAILFSNLFFSNLFFTAVVYAKRIDYSTAHQKEHRQNNHIKEAPRKEKWSVKDFFRGFSSDPARSEKTNRKDETSLQTLQSRSSSSEMSAPTLTYPMIAAAERNILKDIPESGELTLARHTEHVLQVTNPAENKPLEIILRLSEYLKPLEKYCYLTNEWNQNLRAMLTHPDIVKASQLHIDFSHLSRRALLNEMTLNLAGWAKHMTTLVIRTTRDGPHLGSMNWFQSRLKLTVPTNIEHVVCHCRLMVAKCMQALMTATKLRSLDVTGSKFSFAEGVWLTYDISRFKYLSKLTLDWQQFEALQMEITKLESLEELTIHIPSIRWHAEVTKNWEKNLLSSYELGTASFSVLYNLNIYAYCTKGKETVIVYSSPGNCLNWI